jgi:two-component system nitrogen regulation sensor histidine kinase NtrY
VSKINLSKNFIRGICKSALNEDLYPSGDISSNLLKNNVKKKVKLISNQSGIIGGLEFAKQTFKLKDEKNEFTKYLETINRQIIDIKKLVDEFSGFARMPSPILKKIDISDVLKRSIEFYKMSNKNINLNLNYDFKKKYLINGDSEQLNRVFINLIKNSMEAIDEKKQKDTNLLGKIDVEIIKNNEYIEIKMLDNGSGFKNTKDIIKPYYTTKKEGTGLGLPIVTKIINEHEGDIQFLQNTNGAEIKIYLPKI